METLQVKEASQIDKDGYFVKSCMVNEDPFHPGVFMMPDDVIILDPPETKPGKRFKYILETNSWLEEDCSINKETIFEFKNTRFSINHIDISTIVILLLANEEEYKVFSYIEDKLVVMTKAEFKEFCEIYAKTSIKWFGNQASR